MDRYDIKQIMDMFPCLISYLSNDIGYLIENLSVYRLEGEKYSHFIEFVMLEETRRYETGFDTVALRLYFRKTREGAIKYKHKRVVFIPEKGFYLADETTHRKYEDLFDFWWESVQYVLLSKYYATRNLEVYKKELLVATYKPIFDDSDIYLPALK
jgi:hypothetical protein